jgi:hypothetical protein
MMIDKFALRRHKIFPVWRPDRPTISDLVGDVAWVVGASGITIPNLVVSGKNQSQPVR